MRREAARRLVDLGQQVAEGKCERDGRRGNGMPGSPDCSRTQDPGGEQPSREERRWIAEGPLQTVTDRRTPDILMSRMARTIVSGQRRCEMVPQPFNAILDEPLASVAFTRIRVPARGWLFHAGQPRPGLYFVNAGYFRTSVGSDDGRERITAFPMRGDWLGLESIGSACHVSDTVALDASEVWHLPASAMQDHAVASAMAACCSHQLRDQHAWALAIGSLCAERRVMTFLRDQAARHAQLGCSATRFKLRMTRAEMGNFLALQIETVTRALAKLQACGLIDIDRREVTLPSTPTATAIDTPLRQRPGVHDRRAWQAFRSRTTAAAQTRRDARM